MQEYVTDAIVLRKEPLREKDGRYFLFTERFGKIVGKATSSRKITSKLAPHLEPGMISRVRFVEKGGTQIVDALREARLSLSPFDLHVLASLLPDAMPEPDLWTLLQGGGFSWRAALALLGWDPNGTICARCRAAAITHFYMPRQEFFCAACALKLPQSELILL